MLIALSLLTVGVTIASYIPADGGINSLRAFTIMYSVSFGLCNGLAYTVPLKVCWDHFPDRKGTVSGVVIGGFGLGSLIFGFISTLLINADNQRA